MRIFDHFNQSGNDVCPICRTNANKATVLMPIPGTNEGNIVQALQVHWGCMKLWLDHLAGMGLLALPCDHTEWVFEKHGRCCPCGELMVDFGD